MKIAMAGDYDELARSHSTEYLSDNPRYTKRVDKVIKIVEKYIKIYKTYDKKVFSI